MNLHLEKVRLEDESAEMRRVELCRDQIDAEERLRNRKLLIEPTWPKDH